MNTFYWYWLAALVLKIFISSTLPFSSDEAYYWVWSNHLQLSYFDHPGMIAWLLKLGHPFDSFGLRWPTIILGHFTWVVWYQILKDQLTGTRLTIWTLLLLLNPLVGWGTFLAIPDTPATLFWSLSMFAALRWWDTKQLVWAIALGAGLGLGFNAKYHIVLFVPVLLIWLTWIRGWSQVRWAQVPAVIATGLIFCSPVLIWNYQNNFDSFVFQLGHGFDAEKPQLVWPLEYLGAQVGLLFPTVFWLALKPPRETRLRLFYVLGWFPIVFFLWTSFSARPEGNWPILGYIPLLTLAALQFQKPSYLKFTVGVWLLAFVVTLSESYWHWLPMADKSNLKTSEFVRFDEFIPHLESDVPVYASSFQMAATLAFKTRKPVYKLHTLSRKDFYDYLPESRPPAQGRFKVLANRETDFGRTILKDHRFIEEIFFTPQKKVMIYEVP